MSAPVYAESWREIPHDYLQEPAKVTWVTDEHREKVTADTVGTLVKDACDAFNCAYEPVQYGWFTAVVQRTSDVPLPQKILHAATKSAPDVRLAAVDDLAEHVGAKAQTWDAAQRFIASMRVPENETKNRAYNIAAETLLLVSEALDAQIEAEDCLSHPDVSAGVQTAPNLQPYAYAQMKPIISTVRETTPTTERITRRSSAGDD